MKIHDFDVWGVFPNHLVTKKKKQREAAKNPQKEQYPKFVLHIFVSRPENKERAKINGSSSDA